MKGFSRHISILICLILLASCSSNTKQVASVVSVIEKSTAIPVEKNRPGSSSAAIDGLLKNARVLKGKGQAARAAAVLERGIRIQPDNPRLWHQLARVRIDQKKYRQAESLALRSNQYSGHNLYLKSLNWGIISDARLMQGNRKGAASARAMSKKLKTP